MQASTPPTRKMQRGISFGIFQIGVGAMLEQYGHFFLAGALDGGVQRRITDAILAVDVGALTQQLLHPTRLTAVRFGAKPWKCRWVDERFEKFGKSRLVDISYYVNCDDTILAYGKRNTIVLIIYSYIFFLFSSAQKGRITKKSPVPVNK